MARMENNLFHFLVSRNIFKNYYRTDKASEKTEQRRRERQRGRLVWLAAGTRIVAGEKIPRPIGNGAYNRSLHGALK